MQLSLRALRAAGFQKIGPWVPGDDGVPALSPLDAKPGIYLFVVNGKVQYVGKADNLHIRLGSYPRAIRAARRTRTVHNEIERLLDEGIRIDVYTLALRETKRFTKERNGLPLDRLVGLEAGLIEALEPPWNLFNSAARKRRVEISIDLQREAEKL